MVFVEESAVENPSWGFCSVAVGIILLTYEPQQIRRKGKLTSTCRKCGTGSSSFSKELQTDCRINSDLLVITCLQYSSSWLCKNFYAQRMFYINMFFGELHLHLGRNWCTDNDCRQTRFCSVQRVFCRPDKALVSFLWSRSKGIIGGKEAAIWTKARLRIILNVWP